MKSLHKIILTLLSASAFIVPGHSTELELGDNGIIARIDCRMDTLDSLIFKAPAPAAMPQAMPEAVSVAPDSAYGAAVDARVAAGISEFKARTGVQLTGQTYYRPNASFGLDDETEDVSRYTGKIQIEARWYFLQSGLLKRRGNIEELRLSGEVDRLQHEHGRSATSIYAMRESLHQASDSVLASVRLHRLDNLVLLEEAYLYLLHNESITGDDLLRILDERAEAERSLATVSTAPVPATSLASVTACTVEIDTAAIISGIITTDIDLRLLTARSQLIGCQVGNTTWWSDVRLAPFVRYSHYFRHAMPASSNVDVGLSFTIPINTEASHRRAALRAEQQMIDCEREDMIVRAIDRVRYLASEAERLNRAIVGEWRRAAAMRTYLSMRREAYANRYGEFNRLAALKEYNSYLRTLENIIEMQYRRDVIIADLQALAPEVPVLDHCVFTILTD